MTLTYSLDLGASRIGLLYTITAVLTAIGMEAAAVVCGLMCGVHVGKYVAVDYRPEPANTTKSMCWDFDWFVRFRDPREIFKLHEPFVYVEHVYYLWAILTFIHAMRSGGRFPYVWFGAVFHGVVVESISYMLPDIDSFWHAQSSIMFLGARLPLYIVIVYPCFTYTATVAVSHLHLPWWAEPCAVALSQVLLDVPYDIMGIKLLLWSWHDTDPNIFDRHYWVPWTSYYFHASFTAAFTFLFRNVHRIFTNDQNRYQNIGFFKEMVCMGITSLFSMPLGILQIIPIYHVLHDNFNIHTEVCVLQFLFMFGLIVWIADRHQARRSSSTASGSGYKKRKYVSEISVSIVLHYFLYVFLVFVIKPENQKAVGLHEPVGDCNSTSQVYTPIGQVLSKKTFLCLDDYDEGYFDFHCTTKPEAGSQWYTICGTDYKNHMEYIIYVCTFCAIGLIWFSQLLFFSRGPPTIKSQKSKVH